MRVLSGLNGPQCLVRDPPDTFESVSSYYINIQEVDQLIEDSAVPGCIAVAEY